MYARTDLYFGAVVHTHTLLNSLKHHVGGYYRLEFKDLLVAEELRHLLYIETLQQHSHSRAKLEYYSAVV